MISENGLCKAGAGGALALLLYSVITMVALVWLGGPPATAEEIFAMLRSNRVAGLIRLDLPTAVAMPMYYLLYAGLYAALRRTAGAQAGLAAGLAFAGVTLFLATPSVLSMAYLSDQYAAATTDARRSLLLAAGEAVIASDIWHGTGARIGGVLLLSAGVLISVGMLRSGVFSKTTGYVGIGTHGLDLAHSVVGLVAPAMGGVLMAVAGSLYLVWFVLVGRTLYRLGWTRSASDAR